MPSANCTDRIWLNGVVSAAVTKWMVDAHKVANAQSLDQSKKFTDYGIAFATFNQLCDDISGSINDTLKNEPCTQRLTLPDSWQQTHQGDTIAAFIGAVVDQILHPQAGTS